MVEAQPVFRRPRCTRPVEPMACRERQVGGKHAEGSRISLSKRVNSVELTVEEGRPAGERVAVQAQKAVLGFQPREGAFKSAGNMLGEALCHYKTGAVFGHQADTFTEFTRPPIYAAKDAAMRRDLPESI